MAFTVYQFFLAGLMLVTGTINTLSTKWADRYLQIYFILNLISLIIIIIRQNATFCDRSLEGKNFEHPFLQVSLFHGKFIKK